MTKRGIDPREFTSAGSAAEGWHLVASCRRCDATAPFAGTSQSAAGHHFRGLGWKLGKNRACDLCPDCAKPRPKPPTLQIVNQEKVTMAAPTPPPTNPRRLAAVPSAEPPRQPTIEERRRIRQALDAEYDDSAGHYAGDGSDALLAHTLNVPRAWVVSIRELYGPDASANDKARNKELDDAAKIARAATERLIAMAAEAEGIAAQLEAARRIAA